MCLFSGQGYEEVGRFLTQGLESERRWTKAWRVSASGVIGRARLRLGPEVLKVLFARVCRPVAVPELRGAGTPRLRAVVTPARPQGRIPSFLTAGVTSGRASIAGELDGIARTSPGLVRDELAQEYPQAFADPLIAALIRDPEAQLSYLAVEFANFWRAAIEPRGAGLTRSLEEEILFRSRTLAMSGGAALLHELALPLERTDGVERLTVVPMLLADGTHWWSVAEGRTVVCFAARGAGLLRAEPQRDGADRPQRADRLAILLGRGAARDVQRRFLVAALLASGMNMVNWRPWASRSSRS
ncbi:transposase domain-containing protein [Streptomyces sp. NPDC015032]|uniref:transposase domain-containing protein n=1 Tax=Streptomyces sp. NPDC015032 TaxID=3364937 RepID=UPI0036F5D5E1